MKRRGCITIVLLLHSLLVQSYDFSVDGIYYNITSKKDLTVEVTYKSETSKTYKGEVIIPPSVENKGYIYKVASIGASAFRECKNLTSVIFPQTITEMGAYSFYNCENLVYAKFPDSLLRINPAAFSNCRKLKITLPNSIISIYGSVFRGCDELKEVLVPRSLRRIGSFSFYGCNRIESITIPETVVWIGYHTFGSCNPKGIYSKCVEPPSLLYQAFHYVDVKNCILYVPKGAAEAYRNSFTEWGDGWGLFENIVEEE